MNFGQAIEALKAGKRVSRAGWNGKGMFLFLVPGSQFKVNREPLLSIMGEGVVVDYHAHVDMKTAQGYVVPDAFTHGSAEQRARWFMTGFKTGSLENCDTFSAREL